MAGWAKWEAQKLPCRSDKIINWRNYWHIPGKTAEISATLPTHRMESECPCPIANMKLILRVTLDEQTLTRGATPTAVSMPEVAILPEQVKLHLGEAIAQANAFLPHPHMGGPHLLSRSRDGDIFVVSIIV